MPKAVAALLFPALAAAQDLSSLPVIERPPSSRATTDWLLDASPFTARLGRSADARELVLDNGLVRRTWRLAPNAGCVAFDDLVRGESLLRAVRPEGSVTIDGTEHRIGGLVGQPDHAYLRSAWLDAMTAEPGSLQFTGWSSGPIEERLAWKRVRHAAPDATWPPRGLHLRLDFAPPARDAAHRALELEQATARPDEGASGPAPESGLGRSVLMHDAFRSLDAWAIHVSPSHAQSSIGEGKPTEIHTPANTACFIERGLPRGVRVVEATIDPGTDDSASFGPGIALVFADRTVKLNLRPGGDQDDHSPALGMSNGVSESVRLNGRSRLDLTQPWQLRLRITARAILCDARMIGDVWRNYGVLAHDTPPGDPEKVRIGKLDRTGGGTDFDTPGELVRAHILEFSAYGALEPDRMRALESPADTGPAFRVSVHYELYDGVPLISKWLEVHNPGERAITVDHFQSEILAVVEHSNPVETREGAPLPLPDHLHVETDFAFGSFEFGSANRHVVHWRVDPQFTTQVNYLRLMPCLLVVEPTYGPAQQVAAHAKFVTYRTFELAHDSFDRERMSLGLRRMYRTIAPWVTENPLMMHMRDARPDRVRAAIDQCADVGFEMLILSFGSGFDMENDDAEYLAQWKEIADYAHAKGVEIGGYSLLSSRHIGGGNDVVSPVGQSPTHGSCPALTSEWGLRYMNTLRAFFPATGFTLLEHDGPYPGDVDVTPRPPLQKGEIDSRWVQWRIAAGFYEWCRSAGIYVNAPDHYYLNGTNKCGMGYRETNWSLPRAEQVIHTRQNIYDGTWLKTPSMGWMFVPLTEYQGGGAAATIEPLDAHLDHYDRMITSNLALGVQACYRGPRLYDTQRTRDLLARRVAWFKEHRDILESDLIHGRRADGRDVDWMLHVNPRLEERGLLVVFNPTEFAVTRHLDIDLRYTGIRGRVSVRIGDSERGILPLDREGRVGLDFDLAAGGFEFVVLRDA